MQAALTYRTNRDLFSNYYLDEHLPETEEWDEVSDEELREKREEIRKLWDREKGTVADRTESGLEEKFIRPMFRKLGIPFEVEETVQRGQRRPDYGFFPSEDAARKAFDHKKGGGDFYAEATGVADAKRWGRPLDTRGSGEHKRDFENPSYQIHVYLQEVDAAQWAVLTNGQKWRLYYGPTSHRLDSYYEVDLPTILEDGDVEDFKYFYLFFRQEAFLEDASGDSFLDDVYDESNVFAQELGEDLQENIYKAIKILSEGYLQYSGNNLDEEDLELIHDSSLIYLYRLIFVLYAEAEGRDLLDTGNEIYEQSYSLNALKQEVAEELDSSDPKYRDWQDNLSDRLSELFSLIDQGSKSRGIPKEDLYIPAYNGGLFRTAPDEDDSPEARFLANHTVGDAYLARVVELLTQSQNGGGKIFVDYSSLDVRHLGSIYEGLLEYKLDVADGPLTLDNGEYVSAEEGDDIVVRNGEVYLTTGSGERKATGSYYTPEYVVEYIVDETLEPLVDDIREDLVGQTTYKKGDEGAGTFADQFAERVFELNVLDPAMGSGHFLTSAIDYLAREIIDAQERQAEQQGVEAIDKDHDINWARRQVAQRCIYGVDLNPLAVELSKVSLWLRTLAAEQPLAFLDHHLKTGNSLVGSDIEDVLSKDSSNTNSGQLTLQQSFDRTRQRAIELVMDRFEDLITIDNETLKEAKHMEDVYDEVRDNKLYTRLLMMANVHTAEEFGLDVPEHAYTQMAEALMQDSWDNLSGNDWFQSAQAMADDLHYFHWELEFPVVFYSMEGRRREDPGFDAVIGNPPWLGVRTGMIDSEMVSYLKGIFRAAEGQFDIAAVFLEKGVELLRYGETIGFVVPKRIASNEIYADLRELLAANRRLTDAIDLGLAFEEVSNDALILISTGSDDTDVLTLGRRTAKNTFDLREVDARSVEALPYHIIPVNSRPASLDLIEAINEQSDGEFGRRAEITRGAECGMNHEAISTEHSSSSMPAADPSEVGPYAVTGDRYYIDTERIDSKTLKAKEIYETAPKILARFLSDRVIVATDETGLASTNLVYHIRCNSVRYFCGLLSSKLLSFWYMTAFQTEEEVYPHVQKSHLQSLPIKTAPLNCDMDEDALSRLLSENDRTSLLTNTPNEQLKCYIPELADRMKTTIEERNTINLSLLEYLGNYADGALLPDVGHFQPNRSTILNGTSEDYENLRIGSVKTEKIGQSVTIKSTARYKPANEDAAETDQWGYTESDLIEAFTLSNLTDREAVLINAFVPAAVEEAGGFAGFREGATKTNSLIDRLKAITLPDPDDVAEDLRRYTELKERAGELDEQIQKNDQLINQIVYELYELTDDEIDVIESVVKDD